MAQNGSLLGCLSAFLAAHSGFGSQFGFTLLLECMEAGSLTGLASVTFVVGTRPEAIKTAPAVLAARRSPLIRPQIILTGQHPDLAHSALASFDLRADIQIEGRGVDSSLGAQTGCCLAELARWLSSNSTQMVVVQGDTTSAVAGAMAAFYERIPVAHIEAGLRTGDLTQPYPEEANRQVIRSHGGFL